MLKHSSQAHEEKNSPTHQSVQEETKPKRRSFLQLWLPKFKSTAEDHKVEIEPPLTSVELPRIEQLQSIGTDISSEIQFRQQPFPIEAIKDEQETDKDDQQATFLANPEKVDNTNGDQIRTQVTANDHSPTDGNDQPTNKKEPTKRTFLIKLLFPKRAAPQDTGKVDQLLTEQQEESNPTRQSLPNQDGEKSELVDKATNRPSLGRHVSALLSRIPTLKDKPSLGQKAKSEEVGKLLISDDFPSIGYENEKVTGTDDTSATA